MTSDHIRQARLAPAATLAVPITSLKAFGITFSRDEDDLDGYEFAGVFVNGLACGLLHYEHAPQGETTLLLPEGASVEACVAAVSKELDLPLSRFHWRDVGKVRPA